MSQSPSGAEWFLCGLGGTCAVWCVFFWFMYVSASYDTWTQWSYDPILRVARLQPGRRVTLPAAWQKGQPACSPAEGSACLQTCNKVGLPAACQKGEAAFWRAEGSLSPQLSSWGAAGGTKGGRSARWIPSCRGAVIIGGPHAVREQRRLGV